MTRKLFRESLIAIAFFLLAAAILGHAHAADPENAPLGANIVQGVDILWD